MGEDGGDLLVVEQVTKTFGSAHRLGRRGTGQRAVRGVSFTVAAGGSLAIVGESGAGKTTLVRLIMGLEVPDSGRIILGGRELMKRRPTRERRERARVAQVVFQDPYTSLTPHRSVGALLDEAQRIHFERSRRERAARTRELLDSLGLAERHAKAMPSELSGGQRQRVAIARALAAEPRMLILDEAVSALDVSIQAQILNLLADLRDALGLTYLAIAHDLAVVRQLADHVLVIYRGREMEAGTVDAILSHPSHPYTKRLIGSVPRPDMPLERRLVKAAPDREGGCLFASRCEFAHERCVEEPPLEGDYAHHASRCWLNTSQSHDFRETAGPLAGGPVSELADTTPGPGG